MSSFSMKSEISMIENSGQILEGELGRKIDYYQKSLSNVRG